MSKMTNEQLRYEMQRIERDSELLTLRAENKALRAALELEHEETKRLREIVLPLRARVAKLEAALRSMVEGTKWKSADKDNMEFDGRVNCYQLDNAHAALKDAPQ